MTTLSEAAATHSLQRMTLDTRGGSYILGEVIYRRADRCLVKAQRTDACGHVHIPPLVIKISSPRAARKLEEKLVNKARAAAINLRGDMHWVLQHLPNILHAEDLQVISGSTQACVAEVLDNVSSSSKTCEEDILCDERRTLRIVIMEGLFPIDTLPNAADFAQVFFDVLNCHNWLYDNPRILHRDISMSNIMYRFDDQYNVYGVLNDMDLSSDLDDLDAQEATSFLRIGTLPFMAVDLLRSPSSKTAHLYRHDLESLFYVMLVLFTRYQISCEGLHHRALPQNNLTAPPFSNWFDSSVTCNQLATAKNHFIFTTSVSPGNPMSIDNLFPSESSFFGFRNWIARLNLVIYRGFAARNSYNFEAAAAEARGVDLNRAPADEETLDGNFQYSTFFDVMKSFAGKDLRAPPQSFRTR